jgi:hypothetical protein
MSFLTGGCLHFGDDNGIVEPLVGVAEGWAQSPGLGSALS